MFRCHISPSIEALTRAFHVQDTLNLLHDLTLARFLVEHTLVDAHLEASAPLLTKYLLCDYNAYSTFPSSIRRMDLGSLLPPRHKGMTL